MDPDREEDDLPDEDLDSDDEGFDDEGGDQTEVTIEVRGLSLYTHHGVGAAEREGESDERERPGEPGGGWHVAILDFTRSTWMIRRPAPAGQTVSTPDAPLAAERQPD